MPRTNGTREITVQTLREFRHQEFYADVSIGEGTAFDLAGKLIDRIEADAAIDEICGD